MWSKRIIIMISIIALSVKLIDMAMYSDQDVKRFEFESIDKKVNRAASSNLKNGGSDVKKNGVSRKKDEFTLDSLNKNDAKSLEALDGVGPKTAAAIVEYRNTHGIFKSVDELINVKGIGPKKLEAIKKQIK